MKDIAYACALYPLAGYQLTAATLRAALTAAAADSRHRRVTAAALPTAGPEAPAAFHSQATGGSQ
ncbi:hypothetical protein [Streptomyces marianii]|uniref:Uncharacterized protein n=1 Tax=Streptomyces marianii TaxID=1817406 RepID=A0A5R9DT22_9ACTN|nr:hypothetical protein [Streptomyces marianii]TLQ38736.1 hypothetical protein FEF34_40550 [Streptomyces marianii]